MVMESTTDTDGSSRRESLRLVAAAITGLVCLVYLPVLGNGFVNWDDEVYLYRGRLAEAPAAAFATIHASGNWHPLTILSHAVDHPLFGAWAAGHHLTSLLLHGANAGLVVLLASALLGGHARARRSRRVAVAATAGLLWALHPLRVEPVAWVSERKELLCTLFYLLGLLAYLRYAGDGAPRRGRWYAATLAWLTLALLSKPMAVSFPVVLLVLDAYPLARLRRGCLRSVLLEKVPFALLATASAAVTLHAQRVTGAMRALADLPFSTRALVAVQSAVGYLGKSLWPSGLHALYSYPRDVTIASWRFALPVLVLLLLIGGCAKLARPWPACAAGLAAYLLTLLPVAGLIQVGPQAMAERYTYLPGIALAMLAGGGVSLLGRAWRAPKRWQIAATGLAATTLFAVLAWSSVRQMATWRDSERLWSNVLAQEPASLEARNARADFYYQRGEHGKALADYTAALATTPAVSRAHATKRRAAIFNDRAVTFVALGKLDEAVADETQAIRLRPDYADYHANRARMYARMGRTKEAVTDWQRAQTLRPAGEPDAVPSPQRTTR
jgi:tetratricopeptide (TPR) repeat protein